MATTLQQQQDALNKELDIFFNDFSIVELTAQNEALTSAYIECRLTGDNKVKRQAASTVLETSSRQLTFLTRVSQLRESVISLSE